MATYNISSQAVIQVQVLGRLHGQRTRNVFHYLYTGSTPLDGPTTLDELIDEFKLEVWDGFVALLSDEWRLENITAQALQPVRYRARVKNYIIQGGTVGNSLPTTSAVVCRRVGVVSGRRYQGRIFVAGIPAQSESDSTLAVAVRANWNTAALGLKEPLQGGTLTEPFIPVISTIPVVTPLDSVDLTSVDNNLRIQRRREIGVGE